MKKKGTKLIALLMCVLVGVMMFSVISFAEVKSNFYITADKTSVNEGDTVTITVYNKAMTVSSFTGGFAFDNSMFEVTAIEKNSDILPRGSVVSSLEEANSAGTVGFAFTDVEDYTYEPGTVLTAVLKAKKGGSAKIESYEDSDGKDGTQYNAGDPGSTVIEEEVIPEIHLTPVPEKPATCTEAGYKAYWIDEETGTMYSDAAGKNKIDAPEVIPAKGHTWSMPTYTWSDDNTVCTGLSTCTVCGDKTEETATVTKTSTAATCTIPELITYKATFTDKMFTTQSKTVQGAPATGHTWGEPTYTWAADNSSVTATHVCEVCQEKESETAAASSETTATCTEAGETTYKATFKNAAFSEQTKTVDTPALGHDWSIVDDSVKWTGSDAAGYTAATATVKCTRCGEIKENVKSEKVTEFVADNGDKFYTAYFQVDNCTLVSVPKIVKAPEKKSDGGGADGGKGGKDTPPTGDNNAMWLYISGMIAAAMLIAGCGIALRRKAAKNNK